jgi:hypothetical protein
MKHESGILGELKNTLTLAEIVQEIVNSMQNGEIHSNLFSAYIYTTSKKRLFSAIKANKAHVN